MHTIWAKQHKQGNLESKKINKHKNVGKKKQQLWAGLAVLFTR